MSLSALSIWIGSVYVALHLPLVVMPQLVRKLCEKFPRNFWMGALLTAIALGWSALEVNDMPLGNYIEEFKWLLWILTPVIFTLILAFMNELLAPRALGGILLLIANPVLSIQCLASSRATWLIAGLAYLWIIAGVILVLSPFRFRHAIEVACRTDGRSRLAGVLGLLVGCALIVLGFTVFRNP
jgi:putative effector of murein hydrolase